MLVLLSKPGTPPAPSFRRVDPFKAALLGTSANLQYILVFHVYLDSCGYFGVKSSTKLVFLPCNI